MDNRGQTLSYSGPAMFMRCRECMKLTMVNTIVGAADFVGDRRTISVPTSVICAPCRKKEQSE